MFVKKFWLKQTYKVGDREYKPDVTVLTECGAKQYIFEMEYSNPKEIKRLYRLVVGN